MILRRLVLLGTRILPDWLKGPLGCSIDWFLTLIKPPGTFIFRNNEFRYIYHGTWLNERTVEAPIALNELRNYWGQGILEVGNVLHHYIQVGHDVLDKYEKARGVINQDAVDFHPDKSYGLIISVSTIEHVGWDEVPKDPRKVLRALSNLRDLLEPSGVMMITIPVGLNTELEHIIDCGELGQAEIYALKRVSSRNEWRECSYGDARGTPYNFKKLRANAIFVIYMTKAKTC